MGTGSTPTLNGIEATPRRRGDLARSPDLPALVAGLPVVGLMLVWAVHDGGYDEDTWYWGALVLLGLLTAILIGRGLRTIRLPKAPRVAVLAFALYTAWSYLSISWAQSPGDALEGSNRTLLYLLVFLTMLVLPWTARGALLALLVFALGVGVIAIVLQFRLASADNVSNLVISGRLAAPTGYFNSTAALFTIGTLVSIALAARRELPGLLRGLLIAFACADLQLSVIVQSRGWLFTLPLIAIVSLVAAKDRLRFAATALIAVAAAVVPIHRLLAVYQRTPGPLNHAAARAGQADLVICALVLVVGTLLAWGDSLIRRPEPSAARRRLIGTVATTVAVVAIGVGGVAATHGRPFRFISRQWNGFSHTQTVVSSSHFTDVGSGRYDFWRVALDAFLAHPIGGLGQDNFDDYYVRHRRTNEEPSYTHSLELRFLAHTGIVGFVLFATFMVAAIAAVMPARRRRGLEAFIAGVALLPLVVWVIYGSIDWFWEIPALTGPALGFLGVAGALGSAPPAGNGDKPATTDTPLANHRPTRRPVWVRALVAGAGVVALLAALYALVPAYLSVREVSIASDLRQSDPARALQVLQTAADLNPLNSDPGRIAGTIALQTGQYAIARERFQQSISREPGGWYAWLGAGLAASALGDRAAARHYLETAASIDSRDAVIRVALDRVDTAHPLSPAEALQMIELSL